MKTRHSLIVLFFLLVAPYCNLSGQSSRQKIEEQNQIIKRAEEMIRRNNKLLAETKEDFKESDYELKLTRARINSRQEMIGALEKQLKIMDHAMDSCKGSVNKLSKRKEELKKEYAAMLRSSYKNQLQNNYLAFLFAAKDFEDVGRRLSYIRRYNSSRRQKIVQADSLSVVIAGRMEALDIMIAEMDKTKTSHTGELVTLGEDENHYQTLKIQLKDKEKKINRQNDNYQKDMVKARSVIADLVALINKKSANMTPQEKRASVELSGRFDQNKGKLPMPVRDGVMKDRFSKDVEEVVYAGGRGAEVCAVFDGVVLLASDKPFQGLRNYILIQHGSFVTVYTQLSGSFVKTNDKVKANQTIGRLSSDPSSNVGYTLRFSIWREGSCLNPEEWIMN